MRYNIYPKEHEMYDARSVIPGITGRVRFVQKPAICTLESSKRGFLLFFF